MLEKQLKKEPNYVSDIDKNKDACKFEIAKEMNADEILD